MRIKIEIDKEDGTPWINTSIDSESSEEIGEFLAFVFGMNCRGGDGASPETISAKILASTPTRAGMGILVSSLLELFENEGPEFGDIRGIVLEEKQRTEYGLQLIEKFKETFDEVHFVPPHPDDD